VPRNRRTVAADVFSSDGCGGDPSKPVVYEDFLPASAAGIFRSNLDSNSQSDDTADACHYSLNWMAGQIGHHIHDL